MAQEYCLNVKVCEADGLKAADDDGFSDPYCVLQLGNQKARTKIVHRSLNPKWNQMFRFNLGAESELHITLWDKDTFSKDDFLGMVKVDLKDAPIDGSDVVLPLQQRNATEFVSGALVLQFTVIETGGAGGGAGAGAAAEDPNKSGKISGGALSKIKKRINYLREENATDLDLSGCDLKGIPKVVLELTFLTQLNLGFNLLIDFPNLTPLESLEFLDLSGNKIGDIHPSIKEMTALTELLLTGNRIAYLPKELTECPNLAKLNLGNNDLRSLFDDIGSMTKLEELYLNGNAIKSVPESIGNLRSLEVVDLAGCELLAIPEDFAFCTRLIEINLANNQLQVLPTTFGRMTRLANLNVSDNQLRDLPMSIGFCSGMVSCHIEGNPIKSQEMLRKYRLGCDQLIDFLEKRMITYKVKTGENMEALLFQPGHQGPKKVARYEEVAEAPQMTTEEKLLEIKMEARGLLQEILLHLVEVRRELLKTTTLTDAMRFALLIRRLKPEVDKIKALIPPQPQPPLPIIHQGEDKLIVLQKTVNGAIRETEVILSGLQRTLAGITNPQQLVSLVRSIRPVKDVLGL